MDLTGTQTMFADQRPAGRSAGRPRVSGGLSALLLYLQFPTIPHASYMLAH